MSKIRKTEAELEMKTDEGDEIKSQIEALNREKTGKPLEEKKQITSKVVELKKQLLTIDDAKVTIEAKLQAGLRILRLLKNLFSR